MKGCLKTCLGIVAFGAIVFVGLLIFAALINTDSDNNIEKKSVERSSTQKNASKSEQKKTPARSTKKSIPKYEIVAVNPNGHKIFIVTQATKKSQLNSIVRDYKRKHTVPNPPWVINFFSDKKKALRVYHEWLAPFEDSPEYYNRWVYKENVDHSAIAQWSSWDGLILDKW